MSVQLLIFIMSIKTSYLLSCSIRHSVASHVLVYKLIIIRLFKCYQYIAIVATSNSFMKIHKLEIYGMKEVNNGEYS